MFQKIQQLIDNKDALVFVLIDEVNNRLFFIDIYLELNFSCFLYICIIRLIFCWAGGESDSSQKCLPVRHRAI